MPPFFTSRATRAGLGCLAGEHRWQEMHCHANLAVLASIDQNCRLIKGQVFLRKDGQDWRDLWDESGTVTAA